MPSPRKVNVEIYSTYSNISNNKNKPDIIHITDTALVYYKGKKIEIIHASNNVLDMAHNIIEVTPEYSVYNLIFLAGPKKHIPKDSFYNSEIPRKEQQELKNYLEDRDFVNKKKAKLRKKDRLNKEINTLEKRLDFLIGETLKL